MTSTKSGAQNIKVNVKGGKKDGTGSEMKNNKSVVIVKARGLKKY